MTVVQLFGELVDVINYREWKLSKCHRVPPARWLDLSYNVELPVSARQSWRIYRRHSPRPMASHVWRISWRRDRDGSCVRSIIYYCFSNKRICRLFLSVIQMIIPEEFRWVLVFLVDSQNNGSFGRIRARIRFLSGGAILIQKKTFAYSDGS